MVCSMTAFARQEQTTELGILTWELRSVNHRYLDVSWRLPEGLRALEPVLRERLRKQLARGKVDAVLHCVTQGVPALQLNSAAVDKLAAACRDIAPQLPKQATVDMLSFLNWPGVLQAPLPMWEGLQTPITELFDKAVAALREVRQQEGEQINAFLQQRLDAMVRHTEALLGCQDALVQRYQKRISDALSAVTSECDSARVEQELVLLAQKLDVSEELARLQTHLDEVRRVLTCEQVIGRRLDFLMQELNREVNTLSSKAVDAGMTQTAIDMKVLIEQMREQIQNVE